MRDVLQERAGPETRVDAAGYLNAPFAKISELSGAGVRSVGLEFITRLCDALGLDYNLPSHPRTRRSWRHPWDMKINGATFEVKISTEHAGGRFQFNHIRPHRGYEAVLCLGIAPDAVLYGAWTKADITETAADKPAAVDQMLHDWTLRKHRTELKSIEKFDEHIKLSTKALVSVRYRSGSESDRRKMDLLVHLGLHEVPETGNRCRKR